MHIFTPVMYKYALIFTDGPVGRIETKFFEADDVPDAGEPVRQYGEHCHQQSQHDDAVLRIAIELLKQACQPQQPSYLEQVYQRTLRTHTGA